MHISEDALEAYAMAKLPESEEAPVEEHLLICETCQDRLMFLEQFIAATRAAAASILSLQDRHNRC